MNELATAEKGIATTRADVRAAYLADLDAAPKTIQTYKRALKAYEAYLDSRGMGALDATRDDVLAYKRGMIEAGKSAATVNSYLTAVRSLYAWLEAKRIYPNVARTVKGVKRNARSPKDALTLEQAARIVTPKGNDLEELRDAAMLNLMVRRGLRTCEIVRADIGDLRQINGEAVLYVQGKGYAEKGDFVVLNASCLNPVYAYLDARGETDPAAPLFASHGNRNKGGRMTTRSVSRIAKSALEGEGMASARLTAHSLRHTAVTFALLGGATPQEAQAMARHASIETTMIYAHNLDRMKAGAERSVDAFMSRIA